MGNFSYINSGKYNTVKVEKLMEAVQEAKSANADDEVAATSAKKALIEAYRSFESDGINKGSAWSGKYESNVTTSVLVQGTNFSRAEGGNNRFGKPSNWTVENFKIPNGGDGTKQGLDKYSGQEALMLGVWNDRDANTSGDLSNARIYRKVKLEKGKYFFGAGFNANYKLSDQAYMFVSKELCNTEEIPSKSLACYNINQAGSDLTIKGLWIDIPEDMEVYIGFQANLNLGSATQEFRAQKVVFYRVPSVNLSTLQTLTNEVNKGLTSLASKVKIYNTGVYDPKKYKDMQVMVDRIVSSMDNFSEEKVKGAYYTLNEAWTSYKSTGMNYGGLLKDTGKDLTEELLVEASGFSRSDPSMTTRFAAPKHWTVENFKIPNGGDGIKQGLDKYSGNDALMLGIWDDRGKNQSGSLTNARIYRTVQLEPGCYFFGASFNANHNLYNAYMYVADQTLNTTSIAKQAIACLNIKDSPISSDTYGMYFQLLDPKEVVICFQANLASGNAQQEFRAEKITLLQMNTPTAIERVKNEKTLLQSKGIYDLNGRRIATPHKGIYIQDGKKFIQK